MAIVWSSFFRIILFCLPLAISIFIVSYYEDLNKTYVLLIGGLLFLTIWIAHEVYARIQFRNQQEKVFLKFCNTIESLLAEMKQRAVPSVQENSNVDVMSELQVLKGLIQSITQASGNEEFVESDSESLVIHQMEESVKVYHDVRDTIITDIPQEGVEMDYVETAPDISEVENKVAPTLSRDQLLTLIKSALTKDRIEMFIQPIVSLPQRKARHFECFSRLKDEDGTIYNPQHFLELTDEKNLTRIIDNSLLFRCIQIIRSALKKKFDVKFFVNLSGATLTDSFFLESLGDFMRNQRALSPYIVFEIPQKVFQESYDKILPAIQQLKLYGCPFSMDQVKDLNFELDIMKQLNFKFLKVDSDVILNLSKSEQGATEIKKFMKACSVNRIDLILSRVESEDTLSDLMEFQFDYGQGYLFGTPRLATKI